jgi:hypothetical protein
MLGMMLGATLIYWIQDVLLLSAAPGYASGRPRGFAAARVRRPASGRRPRICGDADRRDLLQGGDDVRLAQVREATPPDGAEDKLATWGAMQMPTTKIADWRIRYRAPILHKAQALSSAVDGQAKPPAAFTQARGCFRR